MSEHEYNSDHKTMADQNKSEGCDSETNAFQTPAAIDDVLINELGQFGWFQKRNILLAAFPFIVCGLMIEYIFSAAPISHRCRIPECGEVGKIHKFDPKWVKDAIPHTSTGFASCERYAPANYRINETLETCPAKLFDQTKTIPCEDFIYAEKNTVVYEFDLGCKDWLRVLAGTLHNIGQLFVLPVTGYISDRFGRRIALIINAFNLGLFGIIRSFSVNYNMYLALQFLQSALGGGTYSAAYIFVTELVGPNYRVLVNSIAISLFALGEVILGCIAWLISPWRYMSIVIHIPCFFIISYYWVLSESVRWLLSKKKYTEAREILVTVARVNKTNVSDKSLDALTNSPLPLAPNAERSGLFRTVLHSPVLLRRVFTTPVWWITTTFVYYGLSINSTGLTNTNYLNYILTCAIEIPGFFTAALLLDRLGRKVIICSGFIFCSACNIIFVIVPSEHTLTRLLIYLIGKFSISMVFTSVYLYTSELYPTEYRHTLLGFSSMVGRVGAIAAPLTPALMIYWHGIPSLLFGGMAVIAGLLVLTQPETLGCKMPDTLAEAEAIGNPHSKITTK